MKAPPIILIHWVDAVASSGWESRSLLKPHEVLSCGFLIAEDKDSITLAVSISDDEMNAAMAIPKKWILRRESLTKGKK